MKQYLLSYEVYKQGKPVTREGMHLVLSGEDDGHAGQLASRALTRISGLHKRDVVNPELFNLTDNRQVDVHLKSVYAR
jgi:hypothetical protein